MVDVEIYSLYKINMTLAKINCVNLRDDINKIISQLGGWDKFVQPGDRVFLKPNYNTADPFPASSNLDFVQTIVELVYEAGAREVIVGDSSTIYKRTRNVFEDRGVFSLEKLARPAKVMVLEEHTWIKKRIPDGKFLKSVTIPEILGQVDKLILLPCLKTHFIAKYTGALKLSIGFMKPTERYIFHIKNVEEKIAELNTIIKPDLVIMDARKCFITEGPTKGEVREPNLLLASDSRIEIDTEGVNIIKSFSGNTLADIDSENLSQIKLAKILGIK